MKNLPAFRTELEIESFLQDFGSGKFFRSEILAQIPYPQFQGRNFPIHAFEIGSQDPQAPVFFISGGVHGLEKIGTEVVLGYLRTLLAYAEWDSPSSIRRGRGASWEVS